MTGRAFLRSKTEAEADERRGASAGPRQAELGVVASTLAPALAPIQPHFACGENGRGAERAPAGMVVFRMGFTACRTPGGAPPQNAAGAAACRDSAAIAGKASFPL